MTTGRLHLVYAMLFCMIASNAQAIELVECFNEAKLVFSLDYQEVEECMTYLSQLGEAELLGDSSLCPTYSTISSCVVKLGPQLAEEFKNCAITDDVAGEVCLSQEAADQLLAQYITPVLNDFGFVCTEAVIQEIYLIEIAAQKYYGCTEYIDEIIGDAPVAVPIPALVFFYESPQYGPVYGPVYGPYPIDYTQNDPTIPDEFEVCLQEASERAYRFESKIQECDDLYSALDNSFIYDESVCPTIEQVDACTDAYMQDFQNALKGCATRDGIPGETCLTSEKIARLLTRVVTEVKNRYGIVCMEAIIHFEVTFLQAIVEVAGCTQFVDGQLAGGPFSATEFFGESPQPAYPPFIYYPPFIFPTYPSIPPEYVVPVPVPNPVPIPVPVPVEVPVPVPVYVQRGY